MEIESSQFETPRGELALDQFITTGHILVPPIGLWLKASGELEVILWSSWDPENAPEGCFAEEAEGLLKRFLLLKEAWPKLGAIIADCSPTYFVRYDYGMGAINVGSIDSEGFFTSE